MKVCSPYNHEEIVFEGRTCPLCEVLDREADLQAKFNLLELELEGKV